MWKNIVGKIQTYFFYALIYDSLETNIMVLSMWEALFISNFWQIGTHADSLIAEALLKNLTQFNLSLAYAAVYKDATVPPAHDDSIL